jgi:hypothetical protein
MWRILRPHLKKENLLLDDQETGDTARITTEVQVVQQELNPLHLQRLGTAVKRREREEGLGREKNVLTQDLAQLGGRSH